MAGARYVVMASGIVEAGAGRAGAVSAYVVLSAGHASRIFKLRGDTASPEVSELPAATTVDLGRFQDEVKGDLEPMLAERRRAGVAAAVTTPKATWVVGLVEAHLAGRERGAL